MNIVLYNMLTLFLLSVTVATVPEFRVLAPEFVCPKTNESAKNSNQSYITIKATEDLKISWTVGWVPIQKPSQRFTLMLWRTIRVLEKKLNGPQPERFVFIIKDSELLSGVIYIFNVTGLTHGVSNTKSFSIDYTIGNQKLMDIEGRNDMFSVQLLGGQRTYEDLEFIIEAQVTTCVPTQDYYFIWTISDFKSNTIINMTGSGSRLGIPPFVLKPGEDYIINCQVNKQSNGNIITQASLPIQVLYRVLKVYLSVDYLLISVGNDFTIGSYINQNYDEQYLQFRWECFHNNEECGFLDRTNSSTLHFPIGIPDMGEYIIRLTVNTLQQSATANATIVATERNFPVLEVEPIFRILNEGSKVYLIGNVSNLAPSCTLAWYFTRDEYLISANESEEYQNGVEVSDVISIFSIEECFLNEIIDYTNDTQWRQISANFKASGGRARLVANCSCSLTFDCDAEGISYADVNLIINYGPETAEIMVTPESGVALETLFRISTLTAIDKDKPLFYSFYCKVDNNNTLLLGSYVEHLAVETYLPYIDGSTEVFLEVCDSLGACSRSVTKTVYLQPNDAHTLNSLIGDIEAHIRRCELLQLQRLTISAIVSFTNGNQSDTVSVLTKSLLKMLPDLQLRCVSSDQYAEILSKFADGGIDTNYLL